ncbi:MULTISPECIES: hypothetical protein [unclassified Novosphingobium]|uniref:hypothetical protein n=1 Tax=unclassified Novosphingobium TaxID=2644732 RepID=UPI000D30F070|nr:MULTISPECIES: hypothetical protein [unclassified Novosphingobium]
MAFAHITPTKTDKRIGLALCLISGVATGAALISGAIALYTNLQPAPAPRADTWALVQTIGQDEYVMDHGLTGVDCLNALYSVNGPRGHYACQVER